MGMLSILGDLELDKKATIKNVRYFFEHDWPIIQTRAHVDFAGTKSPIISGMPMGSMSGNANDDKFSIHAQATKWVDDVLKACQGLTQPHRHFLELRYFKRLSWDEIAEKTGYSRKHGYDIINEAFLGFAESFSDTYDYREYKGKSNI
jgi:predicted DNA-binding protein YlxM (UPF0122 family)